MTHFTNAGSDYFAICTEFQGKVFKYDHTTNKIDTVGAIGSSFNSTTMNFNGFYDVTFDPNNQMLYWGTVGGMMENDLACVNTPQFIPNTAGGSTTCIAMSLEWISDTVYVGYSNPSHYRP